jgi:hypothetical protein
MKNLRKTAKAQKANKGTPLCYLLYYIEIKSNFSSFTSSPFSPLRLNILLLALTQTHSLNDAGILVANGENHDH